MRRCLWLLFPLALAACAAIPRDDMERMQRGLSAHQAGQWAQADSLLAPLAAVDDRYLLPLAECRYRQNDEDGARALLADVNHPAAQNVLAALDAELSRETGGSERLTFLQFVRRVAMRYDMDAELLLAFMRQESSFRANAVSWVGAAGLMQLMPATARALGLTVPQENIVKSPPIRSAALDERFHPAKNVEAAANHLRFLLNHYRTDDRHTDLTKAIAAYLSGTGNVRDEIPAYARDYVDKVSANYQKYRGHPDAQAEAENAFYTLNPDEDTFCTDGAAQPPDAAAAEEIARALCVPADDAAALANAALVAEAAGDTLRAAALYARATAASAPQRVREAVQFNAALFAFDTGRKRQGAQMVRGLQLPEVRLEAWLLLAGEAMKEGRYSEADSLLQSAEGMAAGDERVQTARALWEVLAGDRTRGREQLLRLWLADGGQAQAANLLAVLYADLTGAPLRVTDYHHLAGRQAMFAWPVRTHDISSAFGWRPSPRGDDWQQRLRTLEFHFGIDIPGSVGDEVWAAEGGTVVASAYEGDAGEEVEILHEGGYTTLYCHLSRRLVQAGQRVERGQVIGLLGSTGNSTGPHLHFGVYNENKKAVNPLYYLPDY